MLSLQLPGMQAGWRPPWALTPAAFLQDNLAQADKQTPSSVHRGALMKPISAIINSKCDTESDQDDKEERESMSTSPLPLSAPGRRRHDAPTATATAAV
ncbi:hypothetical protein EYF80_012822 [Liparis tanakae]|uniref:Uncharacterized protein n=1 Tax=Liparis tanakae TaxID=230148 RepID=A0A4Z2IG52_9TELE|nr:hypothetical protein EYF80_012822 [Liparis tanakae]